MISIWRDPRRPPELYRSVPWRLSVPREFAGCTGLPLLEVRPRQQRKMVSAAGLAPTIPRPQTECVATTLRAGYPDGLSRRRGHGEHGNTNLGDMFRGEILADPNGVAR